LKKRKVSCLFRLTLYFIALAEAEKARIEELERKLAAEEAERQRIAEEKRQKEEEKRREEEKTRLDEEQPDVEHRHVEMKEKSLFAAKNRFAADTVSYINCCN
jgi:septal ring factor EnvC (AmiA/AmiB activator)